MNKLLKKESLLALIEIIIGAICIIWQSDAIAIIAIILGCGLVAYGLVILLNTKIEFEKVTAIAMMAVGVILVITAFAIEEIVWAIIAITFLLYGGTNLAILIKKKVKFSFIYARPILQLAIGALLLANQFFEHFEVVDVANIIMLVVGVVLVIEGLFEFITLTKKK